MKTERYLICAVCAFGLERLLKREIISLGYEIARSVDGRIYFYGDMDAVARGNLWLRTADRLYLKITEFAADSFDTLYTGLNALKWEDYIPPDGRFWVAKVSSVRSALFSKSKCQSVAKKAIVDRLLTAYGISELREEGAAYSLFLSLNNDVAEVFLNTSGEGLHKRGYRAVGNEAPLKETLAAAMFLLSDYQDGKSVADVMCGSGTVLIEAAMAIKNIAPGLSRDFAFEQWSPQWRDAFDRAKEEAEQSIDEKEIRLLGSDIDYFSIRQAKENALKAGVGEAIAFQKMDLALFSSRKRCGVLLTNPPYGLRTGGAGVNRLYREFGELFTRLNDWSAFILCGNARFEQYFGRKADKNRKLYNGGIKSYLYSYYAKGNGSNAD